MNKKKNGFTLIELLVVIAIISLLASIVFTSLSSTRAKARNSRRLAEIHQIQNSFNLYLLNNNDKYPAVAQGTYCIGVPSSQTCWGDRNMPGSDILFNALIYYLNPLPADPLPTRGWGDRYLYLDGVTPPGCVAGAVTGKFILWRPDVQPASDQDCLGKGFFSCCGTGGPCMNNGGLYCAYKID